MTGKTEAAREFQFFEVMGTNVLANEVVRNFSNLAANDCWELEKLVQRAKHASFRAAIPISCARVADITAVRFPSYQQWCIVVSIVDFNIYSY